MKLKILTKGILYAVHTVYVLQISRKAQRKKLYEYQGNGRSEYYVLRFVTPT